MLVSCTYLGIITIPPSVTKFLDVSLSVLASTAIGSRRCFCFPYIAGHANFQEYMTDMTGTSRAPIIHLDKKIDQKKVRSKTPCWWGAAKPFTGTPKNHAGFCCRQWDGRHTSCYRSPVATRWPQGLTHWISNPENQICCCCKHLSGLMLMCHDFPTFMFRKFFGEDL